MHDSLNKVMAVYDIETPYLTNDGISAIPNIYCIAVTIIDKGKILPTKLFTEYWVPYSDGSLLEAIAFINSADIAVAHNGMGFDIPVIQQVLGVDITVSHYDTLILSKIIFPKDELFSIDAQLNIPKELWASYSLKAFGHRLGNYKIQFEEFDTGLTQQMATYCIQDTNLTADLILFLLGKDNFPLQQVVEIEHQAAAIIAEQTSMGFYLDIDKARELNTALLKEKGEIARELAEEFKPKWLKDGPVKTYKKPSVVRKYLPDNNYTPLIGTK